MMAASTNGDGGPELVGMDVGPGGEAIVVMEIPVPESHPAAAEVLLALLTDNDPATAALLLQAAIFVELRTVNVMLSETTSGMAEMGSMLSGGMLGRLLGGKRE